MVASIEVVDERSRSARVGYTTKGFERVKRALNKVRTPKAPPRDGKWHHLGSKWLWGLCVGGVLALGMEYPKVLIRDIGGGGVQDELLNFQLILDRFWNSFSSLC